MKRLLSVLCALLLAHAASAQNNVGPLELDSTFPPTTQNGRVSVDISNANFSKQDDIATCYVAYLNRATKQVSPFYVAGITARSSSGGVFGIAKYNPDLTPDATFGTNGVSVPFSTGTVYPN